MHNILQRINAVTSVRPILSIGHFLTTFCESSALATSTIIALSAAVALTSLVIPTPLTPARIEVPKVRVIWGRDERDYYDRRDREWCHVRFDVQADLRPLFTYNTKQLFLYLTADYSTTSHPNNRVVVWDRIVRRREDARVHVEGARNKYAFKEIGGSFSNVTADFTLHYNVMPFVGALTWGEAGATASRVKFPPARTKIGT